MPQQCKRCGAQEWRMGRGGGGIERKLAYGRQCPTCRLHTSVLPVASSYSGRRMRRSQHRIASSLLQEEKQ